MFVCVCEKEKSQEKKDVLVFSVLAFSLADV